MNKWSYLHTPLTAPVMYSTLNDAVKKNAENSSDTEAFIYRSPDGSRQSITFKDLYDKARCVAKYLVISGSKRKDKVGLFGPNTLARIIAECGILLAGGVVIQLNVTVQNVPSVVDMLDKVKCRIVIADPGENDNLVPVIDSLRYKDNDIPQKYQIILLRKSNSVNISHIIISDIQCSEIADAILPEVYPEDDAIIFTTSGSTGKPKMVLQSHFNLMSAMKSHHSVLKVNKTFNNRPFSWSGGKLIRDIALGIPRVFSDSDLNTTANGVKAMWKILKEENVENAFLMPYVLLDLITEQNNMEDDGFRLKSIFTAGQIVGDFYTEVLGRFCRTLSIGYGSTEMLAGTCVPLLHPGDHLETGNVGKPFGGVEVRIVDSEGCPVEIGQVGEIQMRSSFLMKEYFGDEIKTNKAFTDDRPSWFRMGDVGLITSSGDLIIRGRLNEIIIRGGWKHIPALFDDVIKHMKGIRLVATVSVPSTKLYEEICVCYIAEQGLQLSPLDVQRFCSAECSKGELVDGIMSIPKYFVQCDEFPMLFNGKLDKQELSRQAAECLNLPAS